MQHSARYWGVITEPSNVLLQIVNRVARNVLRKKQQNKLPKIWEESNVKFPGTNYPPVLSYSRTATYLKCPEVQGVQCSETWLKTKLKPDHHWTRHISWNIKTGPRNIWRQIFQRFYGLMRWEWLLTDQMDGPLAGSVMGTELHFDSDASKVEVGTGWYY